MSNPNEPSDTSKPVVKDKNPHNYRKVGYSMIVISVSLVLIGLLVWAIGDNYHFSSDIMANQEIDAMTPKHGFNLVYYDTAQPVGAKLKLLDAASTIDDAQQKQMQYAKQNPSPNGMVLIFNQTFEANQQLVQGTIATITKLKEDQAKALAATQSQTAKSTMSATVNQTTSISPTGKNATSSNATNVVTNNSSKATTIVNATAVVAQNKTQSVIPSGSSGEKLGMIANVTTGTSHMPTNASNQIVSKSNMTNVNATQPQSKSISISESVGMSAK